MTRKIRDILIAILVLQIIALAFQISKEYRYSNGYETESILQGFDLNGLQSIEIDDAIRKLVFQKNQSNWFLKENDLIITSTRIDGLVAKIRSIKKTRPIIASKITPSRFNVAQNNYSKRVTLAGSDSLTFFFGDSPIPSRSYLRFEGEREVYEVDFWLKELDINLETWMKPTLLPENDSIEKVFISKLTLKSKNDTINSDFTPRYLDKAEKARILGLLKKLRAELYTEAPKMTDTDFNQKFFSLTTTKGSTINYHLFLDHNDSTSIISRDDSGKYFQVPKKQILEIIQILENLADLNTK